MRFFNNVTACRRRYFTFTLLLFNGPARCKVRLKSAPHFLRRVTHINNDSSGPHVKTSVVSFVTQNFRGKIGRCAALLIDRIALLDDPAHAEVAKLDPALAIHQHVVKLDVSMQHTSTVAVAKGIKNLLENCLGALLVEPFALFDVLKKITAA